MGGSRIRAELCSPRDRHPGLVVPCKSAPPPELSYTLEIIGHPWIRGTQEVKINLDMIIYRLMRAYISSSSLRKSALRALAKALTTDQLFYLREQFTLFGPNKSGHISLQNMKTALMKNSSGAMNDSRILDFVNSICNIQYGMIDFEEFSAAAISVYQMEGLETWEEHAQQAYELFDKVGKGLLKD
ncbi:hypothetical protein ZEAMMB73_Zm00001d049355 [Zea mays]|uniref:Uncharacterized protein n=3 Tax=Zea mays TaxID=4577 RepID=A0A1D6PTY8_MAIZE|nr:hypothetical protein ZEAMMB73_Zm00001d049355 [Zea mays]